MKVVLAQISFYLGDIKRNIEKHGEIIKNAIDQGADLIIFPELSLTGYLLQDLVQEIAVRDEHDDLIKEIKKLSKDVSIIAGYVEEKEKGIFYNSASFFHKGEILHTHRKIYLPTFGIFEEKKFFTEGKKLEAFETPFGRIGLLICRDFMHISTSYLYYLQNVDFIITISASPARGATEANHFYVSENWELMGKFVSRFFSTFTIYVGKVGFEDGLGFVGGSFVYDPYGNLVYLAPYMDEALGIVEIDPKEVGRARAKGHFRSEELEEIIFLEMERIVKRIENKS